MSDPQISITASEYKALADRIAVLESDERRRIAGQIITHCLATSEYALKGRSVTLRRALEVADEVIAKLEAGK